MSYFDRLPDYIDVDGVKLRILTDFRVWTAFERMMRFASDPGVVVPFMQKVLPDKKLAGTLEQMLGAMVYFYACGETAPKGKSTKKAKRIIDYELDSGLIYAAFMAQYRIDLTEESLHWWRFRALFDGLNESHQIVKIMGYRAADVASIKDPDRRKHYREMQNRYKLPDIRTPEEIERDNIRNLEKFF